MGCRRACSTGTWVHAGLSPATPNHDYQAPLGPYGYDPNLATDAGNRTVLAWYSNAAGHLGVQVQDVGPDGAPAGAASTMPNTGDMQVGMLGRTPLVARRGGGAAAAGLVVDFYNGSGESGRRPRANRCRHRS